MANKTPLAIAEFPLTPNSARKIINDLAKNHTRRIKLGKHTRDRMAERGVSRMQILHVLQNSNSRFTEEPHQTAAGDWKLNLQCMSAGELIEVVVVLKRHEDDPSAFVVTVIVK